MDAAILTASLLQEVRWATAGTEKQLNRRRFLYAECAATVSVPLLLAVQSLLWGKFFYSFNHVLPTCDIFREEILSGDIVVIQKFE